MTKMQCRDRNVNYENTLDTVKCNYDDQKRFVKDRDRWKYYGRLE